MRFGDRKWTVEGVWSGSSLSLSLAKTLEMEPPCVPGDYRGNEDEVMVEG